METAETTPGNELPFRKSHAFLIGINDYSKVSRLKTAIPDAVKLAEVFEKQHGFTIQALLLNPGKAEIENLLQKTIREIVQADDRVVFYFAGHGIAGDGEGGPAGYIVPVDAEPTLPESMVSMDLLNECLNALPCRHFLLILDCCFSGAFRWSGKTRAIGNMLPKKIYKERFDKFVSDHAWQVLTSAAQDQKALDVLHGQTTGARDTDDSENSPFVTALIKGLSGKADLIPEKGSDGLILVTELYIYLRDIVETESIASDEKLRQTPAFFPLSKHDKGEFLFLHPFHRLNLPPIPKKNPFMGLKSSNEIDRPYFFGRERVIKELVDRARKSQFLVVTGPSGSGKSSVIKAGLIPVIRNDGFEIFPVMRPGSNPIDSLEVCFNTSGFFSDAIKLENSIPESVIEKLNNGKFLLFMDQFEELLTRTQDPKLRRRFADILLELFEKTKTDLFKIVVTIRADYEPQFATIGLERHWKTARFIVPPFTADEWREIIVMPALQEVLYYDPPTLVDEILEEVIQSNGALPLLSFTLSELFEMYVKSGRTDRSLKADDYYKLGGVIGSLRTKADELYNSLDKNSQETMQNIIFRMVVIEGGEIAGKRVEKKKLEFESESENQRAVEIMARLLESRLISTGISTEGDAFIEPAHDALVRAWARLWEWRKEIGDGNLILRAKVAEAAGDYTLIKDKNVLWHDDPRLGELKNEIDKKVSWPNKSERDFFKESFRLKNKKRRRAFAVLGVVLAVVSILGITAIVFGYTAGIQKDLAVKNLKSAKMSSLAFSATDFASIDPTQALRIGEEAYKIDTGSTPLQVQKTLLSILYGSLLESKYPIKSEFDLEALIPAEYQKINDIYYLNFTPNPQLLELEIIKNAKGPFRESLTRIINLNGKPVKDLNGRFIRHDMIPGLFQDKEGLLIMDSLGKPTIIFQFAGERMEFLKASENGETLLARGLKKTNQAFLFRKNGKLICKTDLLEKPVQVGAISAENNFFAVISADSFAVSGQTHVFDTDGKEADAFSAVAVFCEFTSDFSGIWFYDSYIPEFVCETEPNVMAGRFGIHYPATATNHILLDHVRQVILSPGADSILLVSTQKYFSIFNSDAKLLEKYKYELPVEGGDPVKTTKSRAYIVYKEWDDKIRILQDWNDDYKSDNLSTSFNKTYDEENYNPDLIKTVSVLNLENLPGFCSDEYLIQAAKGGILLFLMEYLEGRPVFLRAERMGTKYIVSEKHHRLITYGDGFSARVFDLDFEFPVFSNGGTTGLGCFYNGSNNVAYPYSYGVCLQNFPAKDAPISFDPYTMAKDENYSSVVSMPDGLGFVCLADSKFAIWDRNGKKIADSHGAPKNFKTVLDKSIAIQYAGEEDTPFPGRIKIAPDQKTFAYWNLNSVVGLYDEHAKWIRNLEGNQKEIEDLSFSPSGNYFLTVSVETTSKDKSHTYRELILWQLDGTIISSIKHSLTGAMEWAKDESFVMAADHAGNILEINLEGKIAPGSPSFRYPVQLIRFAPSRSYAAIASKDLIFITDSNFKILNTLIGHHSNISSIEFSANGEFLVSSSDDLNSILWTNQGETVFKFPKTSLGKFSPDGRFLLFYEPEERTNIILLMPGEIYRWLKQAPIGKLNEKLVKVLGIE